MKRWEVTSGEESAMEGSSLMGERSVLSWEIMWTLSGSRGGEAI